MGEKGIGKKYGAGRNRTDGLLGANQTLSHLSYSPITMPWMGPSVLVQKLGFAKQELSLAKKISTRRKSSRRIFLKGGGPGKI